MTTYWLGKITLNLSFVIYIIWFVPQLMLNYQRKSTIGLSYTMHSLLLIGYFADLLYGFGREMPWQYRTTTLIGLLSLGIQHYQIGHFNLNQGYKKILYLVSVVLIVLMIGFVIYHLTAQHHNKAYYDFFGLLSQVCWAIYALPQIITNCRTQSTKGLSLLFIVLSLFTAILDNLSAWFLHWDYPSKIGLPLHLLKKIVLIGQFYWYRQSSQSELKPKAQ